MMKKKNLLAEHVLIFWHDLHNNTVRLYLGLLASGLSTLLSTALDKSSQN